MALQRDNFTVKTIDVLAKRVGYHCSNPNCRRFTVGPNSDKNKATILGIAAHITAASPGGPRYNIDLSIEERKDIDNGIWLCTNCATLIDKDEKEYSTELLNKWKKDSEDEVSNHLKGIKIDEAKPYLEADLIWANSQRWNKGYSYKNKEVYGDYIVVGENKPIIIWNLVWNFNFAIYNNSQHPAFNVQVEQVSGKKFTSIDSLPKINNLPPYADLKLRARIEDYFEGISTEADKLISPKVPNIIQDVNFRITYNDENGKKHSTLFTIHGDEFVNSRE
jgi:hypothetical protein